MAWRWTCECSLSPDEEPVVVEARFTGKEEAILRAYDQYAENLRRESSIAFLASLVIVRTTTGFDSFSAERMIVTWVSISSGRSNSSPTTSSSTPKPPYRSLDH